MRRASAFVAITLSIAFVGCEQILGIGDVELRDAGVGEAGVGEASTDGGANDAAITPCVLCTSDNDGSACALACNVPDPDGVALAGGGLVYWTVRGEAASSGGPVDGGGLWVAPLDISASPTRIENLADKLPASLSLAVLSTDVIAFSLEGTGEIRITDGGVNASVPLASGLTGATTVEVTNDGTAVFAMGKPGSAPVMRYQIADGGSTIATAVAAVSFDLSAANLGWASQQGDVTYQSTSVGSSSTTIASSQGTLGPIAFAGNSSFIAWSIAGTTGTSMQVVSAPLPDAGPTPLATESSIGAMRFQPGSHVLFFTDTTAGIVFRATLDGPVPSVSPIATGQDRPTAIDVGNDYVVWTNEGAGGSTGSVMRMHAQ